MNMYLNTITELCADIDSPNKTTVEFINKVATAWVSLAAQHSLKLTPDADAKDALQALACLIDNTSPDGDVIEDYLGDAIAFGSFKECYPWTDNYVIKFCARRNPTLDEQSLLLHAAEYNTSHFFVPTAYVQLPRFVESPLLDKDDDEIEIYDPDTHRWTPNPEWEDNSLLDCICIQPRIAPLHDSDENDQQFCTHPKDWKAMTEAIPQLAGEENRDWYALGGVCLNWLIEFAHYYGKAGLVSLRDFCGTFGIWDLHAENVGNLIPSISGRGAPVILDWMSR